MIKKKIATRVTKSVALTTQTVSAIERYKAEFNHRNLSQAMDELIQIGLTQQGIYKMIDDESESE